MADTPTSYFSDPRKKQLDQYVSDVFALEERATLLGLPEVRQALFRVRCNELTHADLNLRNEHRQKDSP